MPTKDIELNQRQMKELISQSLKQEIGGIAVYETALKCAVDDTLSGEWSGYLEQTRTHEQALRRICRAFDIDADEETSGRLVLRNLGKALVEAMEHALRAGPPTAAELVACEAS